jgi:hypothetical protein
MEKLQSAVKTMADARFAEAKYYAGWTIRGTGYGHVEHKIIKNEGCSKDIFEKYGHLDFVTPRIDHQTKIVDLP